MKKLKIAVLISGNGSNLQALINSCRPNVSPVEIVCVISNEASAYGLTRAKESGIRTFVAPYLSTKSKQENDQFVTYILNYFDVDLVCLAGFMKLFTNEFCERWKGNLINIHPSLLPKYKGLDVYQRALDDNETVSGCTIHYVTAKMDDGPIIAQYQVPINEGDTSEDLQKRILTMEHLIYPNVVYRIAHERGFG